MVIAALCPPATLGNERRGQKAGLHVPLRSLQGAGVAPAAIRSPCPRAALQFLFFSFGASSCLQSLGALGTVLREG